MPTILPVLNISHLTVPSPGIIWPEAWGTRTADTWYSFVWILVLLDEPTTLIVTKKVGFPSNMISMIISTNKEIAARGLVFEHLAPVGEVSGGVECAQTVGVEPGSLS